jgi:hypothetical protein
VDADDGDVFVGLARPGDVFLECLELVLPPARIVQVFVEQDDGSGDDLVPEIPQDRPGGRIQVAIDVQQ